MNKRLASNKMRDVVWIAELHSPHDLGKRRYLWQWGSLRVSVLLYDSDGCYTGRNNYSTEYARTDWKRRLSYGWTVQIRKAIAAYCQCVPVMNEIDYIQQESKYDLDR